MILNFKVKNFRSYKDEVTFSMEPNSSESKANNIAKITNEANQEFKTLKVAMIYGANASGKSNILRAFFEIIFLIKYKPKVNDLLRIYDSFKLDQDASEEAVFFSITFLGPENIKYIYSFSVLESVITTEELHYFPKGKITKVFIRNKYDSSKTVQTGILGDTFKKKEISVFENQLLLSKFGDDEPHELLSKVFQYFMSISVLNATNDMHLSRLQKKTNRNLSENEIHLWKVKRLIKWADTKIEDIRIIKQIFNDEEIENGKKRIKPNKSDSYSVFGSHNIYKENKSVGNYPMEFKDWSNGTQYLYKLGSEIINSLDSGSPLIIDELDTSLHPSLTRLVVMLFQSEKTNPNNAQLIFTTHDVTLLDRDIIRRDQVWIVDKSEQGVSDLFSLQDFEDVREDTPFEKWYLAGKFGGLPKLNSVNTIFNNYK